MKETVWKQKPLFIASDHGGYQLKRRLIRYIENELNLKIEDLGPHEYVETDDYPDYVAPLTKKVLEKNGRGILICRNGIGVCMTANKVKGIRAGLGYNISVSKSMRNDDDTNVLCLAADNVSDEFGMAITKNWLETEFNAHPRFIRRIKKMEELENKK